MGGLPRLFRKPEKVFGFPKTSMLSKTKQQDRHAHSTKLSIKSTLLCQFMPYPGTVHCTVQVRVHVPGADLPHIYLGFNTHIYTRLVEPDKTGLSPRQF